MRKMIHVFLLKLFLKPETIVANVYIFSSTYKKTHPQDSKLIDKFRQQVLQDHAKIKLDPPDYKEYKENYFEFIKKYGQKVEQLFADFCQSSKVYQKNVG